MGIIAVCRHVAGLARVQEHCQFARSLATPATQTGWKHRRHLRSHVVFERTFGNGEAEVVLHPLNAVGAGCVTVAIV